MMKTGGLLTCISTQSKKRFIYVHFRFQPRNWISLKYKKHFRFRFLVLFSSLCILILFPFLLRNYFFTTLCYVVCVVSYIYVCFPCTSREKSRKRSLYNVSRLSLYLKKRSTYSIPSRISFNVHVVLHFFLSLLMDIKLNEPHLCMLQQSLYVIYIHRCCVPALGFCYIHDTVRRRQEQEKIIKGAFLNSSFLKEKK